MATHSECAERGGRGLSSVGLDLAKTRRTSWAPGTCVRRPRACARKVEQCGECGGRRARGGFGKSKCLDRLSWPNVPGMEKKRRQGHKVIEGTTGKYLTSVRSRRGQHATRRTEEFSELLGRGLKGQILYQNLRGRTRRGRVRHGQRRDSHRRGWRTLLEGLFLLSSSFLLRFFLLPCSGCALRSDTCNVGQL